MDGKPQKNRPRAVFLFRLNLQAGHLLDGAFQLVVRAGGASAFRRHGVDAGNRMLEQAIEAAGRASTGLPGCAVTDLRCTQNASGVASAAVFGHNFGASQRRAGSSNCNGTNAFALFTSNANLANRFDPLNDGVIFFLQRISSKSRRTYCQQSQNSNLCSQNFFNQIHAYTLIVASQARDHGMRELGQYSDKPCVPKQPKVSQGYFAGSGSKKVKPTQDRCERSSG